MMEQTDGELRKKIAGLWACEEKMIAHSVKFLPGGKLIINMSTGNLLGGIVSLFSGEECEGTWAINGGILKTSFDRVPKSWLNQQVKVFGITLNLPAGDLYAKYNSIVYSLFSLTSLKIIKLDDSEMQLQPFRGKVGGAVLTWTRESYL